VDGVNEVDLAFGESGMTAKDIVDRIDLALAPNASDGTKMNALRKTREFMVGLFPGLGG
jgi:hypothetical protein